MRPKPFRSEHSDEDIPALLGAPLTHAELDALDAATLPEDKVDGSSRELLLEAVRTFYFAKQFHVDFLRTKGAMPDNVASTIEVLRTDLMKLGVLAIWRVFDTSPRTRSLARTISSLESETTSHMDEDAAAARDLIEEVRRQSNPDLVPALKYVRHLRNKWAGHASVDRDFDPWGDADSTLSLALIEKALEVLVNAHQDLYEVIAMSDSLDARFERRARLEDGGVPMTVGWSAVVPVAELIREAAKHSATRLIERVARD